MNSRLNHHGSARKRNACPLKLWKWNHFCNFSTASWYSNKAEKNEWNTKMWAHSFCIFAFCSQVSLKRQTRTFFSSKFQHNFKSQTVNKFSEWRGFFLMETARDIFYPIFHFVLCHRTLELWNLSNTGWCLSWKRYATHDMAKGFKIKRALWCDGSECLCSQSLINHERTQECVTNRCASFFFICASYTLFICLHSLYSSVRRSLMCCF